MPDHHRQHNSADLL